MELIWLKKAKQKQKYNNNKLTQNKQLSAQEGCRAQWVATDRRSVGAWSAWCRVVSALHLADSSMEKVCAVWSAHHHRGGRGHMRTQFQSSAPDFVWWLCSSLEGWYSWTTAPSTDPVNIVAGGYFPGWPELHVYLVFDKAHLDTKVSEEKKSQRFSNLFH